MEESPRPDCSGTALPWVSHYLQVQYLCCSFISLLGEVSGEMLPHSPKDLELGWALRYCLGCSWCTLYPLLTRACSCISVSSLKSSLDYSLFPPWRAREGFALDMVVVCVQIFEQLMLALVALPPPLQSPPTTPMCLRNLGDSPPLSVCKSWFLGLWLLTCTNSSNLVIYLVDIFIWDVPLLHLKIPWPVPQACSAVCEWTRSINYSWSDQSDQGKLT